MEAFHVDDLAGAAAAVFASGARARQLDTGVVVDGDQPAFDAHEIALLGGADGAVEARTALSRDEVLVAHRARHQGALLGRDRSIGLPEQPACVLSEGEVLLQPVHARSPDETEVHVEEVARPRPVVGPGGHDLPGDRVAVGERQPEVTIVAAQGQDRGRLDRLLLRLHRDVHRRRRAAANGAAAGLAGDHREPDDEEDDPGAAHMPS
jgi:hypothetical protein